ncbi:MAG: DUF4118 domain-containing protein, partial [Candidatus Melainabacteria bacterium]|nr:DUF4118 domain-containing protein [Candidatus Melainabacteria bacterium]
MQKPRQYIYSVAVVILCSAFASMLSEYAHPPTLLMIYMIGIVYAATKFSERATYFTCLLSVCAYDVIFVEPRWQLSSLDKDSWISLAVVLLVTVVIARMSAKTRRETAEA